MGYRTREGEKREEDTKPEWGNYDLTPAMKASSLPGDGSMQVASIASCKTSASPKRVRARRMRIDQLHRSAQ